MHNNRKILVDNLSINQILDINSDTFRRIPTTDPLLSSISPNLKSDIPFTNRNLNEIDDNDKNAFFNQKKVFADEVTKVMSNGFLFNDNNQHVIANFQELVNNTFNDKIREYKEDNALPEDSIYFIYKGGSAMKMLFEKYKNQLKGNYRNMLKFDDFFERSDADYSICIDKNLGERIYNQILCDMNSITNHILTEIQKLLSTNLEIYCPINNVTDEQLRELLEKCNETLNEKRSELRDIGTEIDEFIGIGFNDKQIFPQGRIPILDESRVHSFKQADGHDYDLSEPPATKSIKLKNFMENGEIEIIRKNFIIKVDYQGNINVPIPAITYLNKDPINPNGIYYYLNETNKFSRNGSNITEFNLHRLKINTILYYRTTNGKFGFLSCPSELIDVSISTYKNWNSDGLVFSEIIQQYNYIDRFNFYSYSLYGFIDDLMKGVFKESSTPYPWDLGPKYEKKIKRLIILLFIYLYENFKNVGKICRAITISFENQNFTIDSLLIKDLELINKNGNKLNVFEDKILSKFYNYMTELKSNMSSYIKSKDIEMNNNYKIFLGYFEIMFWLDDDNTPVDSKPNYLEMLNKYLKYKSKYLSLKKLMIK